MAEEVFAHPTVHGFAHGLIVGVGGFENGVAEILRLAVELENLVGESEGFCGFADGELEGVAGGADDHEGAGRYEAEDAPFLGKAECAGDDFAHAAGGAEVGLIVAHGADGDDGLEAFVEGAGVHTLVAAAAGAGDAEAGAVNLGAGEEVIDGAHVLVNLKAGERKADGEEGGGGHVAVVFAEGFADGAFAGPEGVHDEDEEAEFGEAEAAGLDDGILLGAAPVAMDAEDGGEFAGAVGDVGVGGHPEAGEGLKDQFLDAVAVAAEFAEDFGLRCRGGGGPVAPGAAEVLAECGAVAVPGVEGWGWGVVGAEAGGLGLDEAKEVVGGGGGGLGGGGEQREVEGEECRAEWSGNHGRVFAGGGGLGNGKFFGLEVREVVGDFARQMNSGRLAKMGGRSGKYFVVVRVATKSA